ncbi:putative membrane protein [Clostridium sporogenes]|nr:putative membrane protein [Clostridium sporogenes]
MIALNRNIGYEILYNYKKLNYKITSILMLILSIFIIFSIKKYFELNISSINNSNMWDLYSFAYIDTDTLINVLFFFSLYFTSNCFNHSSFEMFIQIRGNNFFKWFSSKIISIFIFNIIISTITAILLIVIGISTIGYSLKWSSMAQDFCQYSKFYSPQKVVCFNIITYSFLVTFLSEILGILFLKFKNNKIPMIMSIIYFIVDKFIFNFGKSIMHLLRYLSLNSYLIFANREFYKGTTDYITVKAGIIIPIFLMIFIHMAAKVFFKIKFLRLDKYND